MFTLKRFPMLYSYFCNLILQVSDELPHSLYAYFRLPLCIVPFLTIISRVAYSSKIFSSLPYHNSLPVSLWILENMNMIHCHLCSTSQASSPVRVWTSAGIWRGNMNILMPLLCWYYAIVISLTGHRRWKYWNMPRRPNPLKIRIRLWLLSVNLGILKHNILNEK